MADGNGTRARLDMLQKELDRVRDRLHGHGEAITKRPLRSEVEEHLQRLERKVGAEIAALNDNMEAVATWAAEKAVSIDRERFEEKARRRRGLTLQEITTAVAVVTVAALLIDKFIG